MTAISIMAYLNVKGLLIDGDNEKNHLKTTGHKLAKFVNVYR